LLRLRHHGDVNHVEPARGPDRKYTLNTAFFDEVTTEAQAYWLGFITADGGITLPYMLRIGLAIRDVDHVARVLVDLGSNRPPILPNHRPHAAVARFDSRQLVDGLGRLGVGPCKSGTVEPWDGPADLMPHYWRGLFDGDGCISHHRTRNPDRKTWSLKITGSEACVRGFGTWAREVCGSTAVPRIALRRTWEWTVGGGAKPQLLAEALYRDATVYLDRKQELAAELCSIKFPAPRRDRPRGGRRLGRPIRVRADAPVDAVSARVERVPDFDREHCAAASPA
jgi:hypothetical protein